MALLSAAVMVLTSNSVHAAVIGQLGILTDAANGGTNPATGEAWKAGDTYRLVFLTSTTTTAGSTNIADYNAFVQSAANAAGYGSVTWKAIGSTATVSAISNTGTSGTGVGIFDFNNTKIADGYTDLWDGSIDSTINYTEAGLLIADTQYYTGTDSNGLQANDGSASGTGRVLGGSNEVPPSVQLGRNRSDMTNGRWMRQFSTTSFASTEYRMLAMSEELTVVPEPSSVGLGLIACGLAMLRRRR